MKIPRTAIAKVTEAVFGLGCRKATVYLGTRLVVKATALHKQRKNASSITVLVTAGMPNYAERKFIETCFRAGESLPVRKVNLKWWPKPRRTIKPL